MTEKATANREPNYTDEMVAIITDAAPLNLEKAKAIGEQIGKSWRSVVSKAKSLGLEYESMPAPAKKEAKETKAEIVAAIEARAKVAEGSLWGLDKATVRSLNLLRDALPE